MAKKRKKKKKIKVGRVFLALLFFACVLSSLYFLSLVPVRGFYITGNNYYTDQEVLEKTSLIKYPSYLLTTSFSINKKISNDPLINNIKIKRKLNGMFEILVNENRILFYDNIKKKSITDTEKEVDYYYNNSPVLINQVEDKKIYSNFISKMKNLNNNIIFNISEIKYEPNDIDKERFLFSMNDGNYVYVTLSKLSKINNYFEIVSTLGSKNGILYLDYGNYFVPKE